MEELWRRTEQRGYYTKLQQGANLALHELGLDHAEVFGGSCEFSDKLASNPLESEPLQLTDFGKYVDASLRDTTVVFDCIELFSGQGNWSRQHEAVGLRVHPGIERGATGLAYGDLTDDDTFRVLAKLAYMGSVRDWRAGPPCWSFGTFKGTPGRLCASGPSDGRADIPSSPDCFPLDFSPFGWWLHLTRTTGLVCHV